ncbi:hypothetical protein V8C34DRAFT_319150 [Trichoderma compactum]
MTSNFEADIKAIFLVTKKYSMIDEEFEQYYIKIHIPMVTEILVRHNVLQYSVVSTSRMHLVDARAFNSFNYAVESINCDAVVTTVFPDIDALEATFADPDLPLKLHPDEKSFREDNRRIVISNKYLGVRDGKRVA